MRKKQMKYAVFDDREKYETGRKMLMTAQFLAHTHGMWDNDEAKRVFGNGWLKEWDDMPDYPPKEEKKVKKNVKDQGTTN